MCYNDIGNGISVFVNISISMAIGGVNRNKPKTVRAYVLVFCEKS
jgi:hypothetical protein